LLNCTPQLFPRCSQVLTQSQFLCSCLPSKNWLLDAVIVLSVTGIARQAFEFLNPVRIFAIIYVPESGKPIAQFKNVTLSRKFLN